MLLTNVETDSDQGNVLSPYRPSHPFIAAEIEKVVTRTAPGVYALGYLDRNERFVVAAVGRADEDLKDELSVKLMLLLAADLIAGPDSDVQSKYARFKFSYSASADEAFENECISYHQVLDTGGHLEDPRHPTKDGEPRSFCPVWQCAWNY